MKFSVIATQENGFGKVIFNWINDDTFNVISCNVSEEVLEEMLEAKVQEGCDFEGWNVEF